MNKNVLLTLLLWALGCAVYAQGLSVNADGAAPHNSAMLDVASNSKGVLIPRIALTGTGDITTIASPETSLLVYNSATAGTGATAVLPGFYFWNGGAWVRVTAQSDLSSVVWALSGNAGTTDADFIGTTDNRPLVFKVNNILSGQLSPGSTLTSGGNTSWGYGALVANTAGHGNTASGFQALYSNTTGAGNTASGFQALYSNTIGNGNTASGFQALYSNTMGYENTAYGPFALNQNISGRWNTASGENALYSNTTGYRNTASGLGALNHSTTGYDNTASGSFALSGNTTGNFNTALGSFADVSTDGLTNATAIGALARVGKSNALVLGSIAGVSEAISDVFVGIGTTTPAALLHVETGTNYSYGLLVQGSSSQQSGSVPDLGRGSRMMFYPGKAAFRAGYVSGTQWDDANVGYHSSALGVNAIASEYSSTAIGFFTTASGNYSTAMGEGTRASGAISTAIGEFTTAKAVGGTALGGWNDDADQPASTPSPGDRLFQVGNGTYAGRSNALTVLRNGSMGMGTTTPEASALLDLSSTTRGLLVPRMTAAQRSAITNPAQGLLVYQTDETEGFYFYRSTGTPAWVALTVVEPVPLAEKAPAVSSASLELSKTVLQQQALIEWQAGELKSLKEQVQQLSKAVEALSTNPQKQ